MLLLFVYLVTNLLRFYCYFFFFKFKIYYFLPWISVKTVVQPDDNSVVGTVVGVVVTILLVVTVAATVAVTLR